MTEAVESVPPPAVTANATVTPDKASPSWSLTSTTNGSDNSVLTVAVWLLPDIRTRFVATRATAVAVAVNVIGVAMPEAVAVTVFVPVVEPRVSVDSARPLAFVVTLVAESVPPPAVTANATVTPERASPFWSRTSTMNGSDKAVLTTAD